MSDLIVEVDSRNRVSLSRLTHKHDRYIVREEADGTVIRNRPLCSLRQSETISANPEVQAAVEYSRQHQEQRRPRPRRRDSATTESR